MLALLRRHAPQRRSSRRRQGGQALAEFALVVPVLMLIVIGTLDVGRAVFAYDSVANAAREAARFAIVHGGTGATSCPVGPPAPSANVPNPSSSCPFPSPSTQMVRNVATNAAVAAGPNVTVTVCYGAGCTGNTSLPGATNQRGTPVTVRVTSELPLVAPALLGLGSITVGGSSTMIVSN
jgi:Flp pilus assembly protein TadG